LPRLKLDSFEGVFLACEIKCIVHGDK